MLVPRHFFYVFDIAQVLFFLCQGVVFRFQLLDFVFCTYPFLTELVDPVSPLESCTQQRHRRQDDQQDKQGTSDNRPVQTLFLFKAHFLAFPPLEGNSLLQRIKKAT